MIELELLIPLAGLVIAWLGFIEKRLHSLKNELESRLKDREKIERIVSDGLKEDIERLEGAMLRLENKIDKLLGID